MTIVLVALGVIAFLVFRAFAARADARWREFLDDMIAEWRARRRS